MQAQRSSDDHPETHRRTDSPIALQIIRATIHELLHTGLRRLRTARIAAQARTTESTVYRHFDGGLEELLAASYNHSWRVVNEAISRSAFERPLNSDPLRVLLDDMAAIWAMRDDAERAEPATAAFLFLRRRAEMLGPKAAPDEQQLRFEARLGELCAGLVEHLDAADGDQAAGLLRTLLLNYLATVWLTWFCMPTGSDDLTAAQHNLSADEAQMGVLSLIERALSVDLSAVGVASEHSANKETPR
jgi:AcrR family transcriptional regulator